VARSKFVIIEAKFAGLGARSVIQVWKELMYALRDNLVIIGEA